MARSFIFSNLSVVPLLQKCRVSEEWLKCGAMKDKYKSRLIWKGNILFMRLTNINYKLDTGSQVNILPKKEYTKLIHKPKLHPAKVKLTSYNGTDIPVVCKCIVTLKNGYQEYKVLFIVAEMDSVPLVGLNTCKKLNLINRLM